ncbi:hypothetical protein [Actinacidiphila glaucinigra]
MTVTYREVPADCEIDLDLHQGEMSSMTSSDSLENTVTTGELTPITRP